MKPLYHPLRNLFGQSERFIVPLFQRPYVWTQEEQWEPLWADMQAVSDRVLAAASGEAIKGHFLGSVVLEQRPHDTGSLPRREVIDGQQRLTTLQVMLHAAAHAMAATAERLKKVGDGAAAAAALLAARQVAALTTNSLVSEPDQSYKVWPTNDDRAAFREVMDATEPTGLASASHRLAMAYRFFHNAVTDYLKPDIDGLRTRALAATVQDHVRIIVLDLEPTDEPQAIFETLNARGTPLLPADLVKNWLLWEAERQKQNVLALYEAHWRPFDSDAGYWRVKIGTGHASRPRADTFLQNWLTERTFKPVPSTHLYEHFLRYAAAPGTPTKPVATLMAEIQEASKLYRRINQPSTATDRFTTFLRRLDAMEIVSLHPLLMHLLARPGTDQSDLDAVAVMLESYLVRRLVCGMNTRSYNIAFVEWLAPIAAVAATEPVAPALRKMLSETLGKSARWPSDADFLRSWSSRPLYGVIRRERLLMILSALEGEMRRKAPKIETTTIAFDNLEIEHVLPQKWQPHWPLPVPGDVEATAQRDAVIDTIGNLTLVTEKLNPVLSNSPWLHADPKKSKKAGLDEHSILLLNKKLVKSEEWGEAEIEARAKTLFATAIAIWPGPAPAKETP